MGLDAIESARPDGDARATGVVRLWDAQRRGIVMAKRAAKAIETKATEHTITEETALAAVREVRGILEVQGWAPGAFALVVMWEGVPVGGVVMGGKAPCMPDWPDLPRDARLAIVSNGYGARVAVVDLDGELAARVLSRMIGRGGYRAVERDNGAFDVFTHAVDAQLVASGLTEDEARAMVNDP